MKTDPEYIAMLTLLLDDEISSLGENTKEEAAALCRAYYGDDVIIPQSPAYLCVVGFILGIDAGFRITEAMQEAANEKKNHD